MKSGRALFELDVAVFTLIPVLFATQLGDTGSYTCVASSPNGEASWTAHLQVEGRLPVPRRRMETEIQAFEKGASFCRVWSRGSLRTPCRPKPAPRCSIQTGGDRRHPHLRDADVEVQPKFRRGTYVTPN